MTELTEFLGQEDGLVAIARIVKPRGLRGEVVADILTDFPERFKGLERITALMPGGKRAELKIEEHWFQKNRVILKFENYDTVETAENLRDAEICVPESDTVDLEVDEYFDWQLIGCSVVTIDGQAIGKVSEVMRTGGTEILTVKGETKDFLIPFAATICTDVDIEKKVVRVDPPDGLLEF
ncbi:MAG: ribosome maturation factor RimM [Pyrinomonadaceae bacterium]